MKNETRETTLLVFEKLLFSIVGGLAILLLPFLRQWWIFVLWGPVLGFGFIWAYSETRDTSQSGAPWRKSKFRGVTIGVAHIVAVTCIWFLVHHYSQ